MTTASGRSTPRKHPVTSQRIRITQHDNRRGGRCGAAHWHSPSTKQDGGGKCHQGAVQLRRPHLAEQVVVEGSKLHFIILVKHEKNKQK